MKDPNRLLSQPGTLEAQLLEAVREVELPPSAHDEVWRRLGVAAGAGAATLAVATPLAARAAAGAGTKALAQTGWISAVKWVALVGTLAPAAGIGVHWVVASRQASRAVASAPPPVLTVPALTVSFPQTAPPPAAPTAPETLVTAPVVLGLLPRHNPHALSSLDAESSLLRHAREKLENGDPKTALDDVAALAARFPRGELTQEREVVAIHALLALGRRSAAYARTDDFLRLHPNSPYADSLRLALKP
jgi:outer membrane lipoprotein YfiO